MQTRERQFNNQVTVVIMGTIEKKAVLNTVNVFIKATRNGYEHLECEDVQMECGNSV
jgi:hypothetical protein